MLELLRIYQRPVLRHAMATAGFSLMDTQDLSQQNPPGSLSQYNQDILSPEDARNYGRELEEMKNSLEMAHQANRVTQNQVGGCIHDLKKAIGRIDNLEKQMTNLRIYASELEEYCISLDITIRKHHILLTGVAECSDEMVNIEAYRVLHTCYPELELLDIDYSYRIGFNPISNPGGNRKNRPILVRLMREDHRRLIFQNRKVLKDSENYSSVYISDDLPQVVNERRADIRSVYLNAINKGQNASMAGTKVTVNNVTYKHNELNNLPSGLSLSDSKLVQVRGGIAFSSHHAYLSNFYPCSFKINGQNFDCAERAYQYSRAMHLNAPELAKDILAAKNGKECKKQSYFVKSTPKWDNAKRGIMKMIVQEKFSQNADLKGKLLDSGTTVLIEATIDTYWGAGATLGSKSLKEGNWSGRNELGIILHEVREDLRRTESWNSMTNNNSSNPHNYSAIVGGSSPRKSSQSNQSTISFIPPGKATEIENALNNYANFKSKKKGANKKGSNRKQAQLPQGNKPATTTGPSRASYGAHAPPPPSTSTSAHLPALSQQQQLHAFQSQAQFTGNNQQIPTRNLQSGIQDSQLYPQQAPSTLPFPNTTLPPPGMPFSQPYPYMGYYTGFPGQTMSNIPTSYPYPPSQFGFPMAFNQMQNPPQVQNQGNIPSHSTNSYMGGSMGINGNPQNSASTVVPPIVKEGNQSPNVPNSQMTGSEVQNSLVNTPAGNSNLNPAPLPANESGIQQQSLDGSAQATFSNEVKSPSKLAETLFPDDLSIRIGTQEI